MNQMNKFSSQAMAAVFALLLSATMVVSAVGPAYNVKGASAPVAQGLFA